GFNAIAWQDRVGDGSKLFLENLDPTGTVNKSLMVTYPQFQSLAEKSGWKKKPLDTIFVKSKLAGDLKSDLESRMAAKTMVLRLLFGYGNSFNPPKTPILKEKTKTDLPDSGEFVITFSVKSITQIE